MRSLGPPLKRVMNELGRAILDEMRTSPLLTAAIDQHVAAVRDAVVGRDGRVEQERLVDYLLGIMDAALHGDWADTQFRVHHSWPHLRMAAVCWLAREHGYVM